MEGEKRFEESPSISDENYNENNTLIDENEESYIDRRTTKEKLVVGIVIIVSFFAVIFGFWQFSKVIKQPFTNLAQYQRDESGCINGDCNLQAEILAIAYQQQKDTDSDGLSDYDEINIYKTSPYLEDTDGDGFTDKEEIDSGNDPNCPGSENCFNDPTVSSSSLIDIQSITSGNSTPQELRDLLLQKGFPAEALSSISDDDLMATYQQVLSGGDYVPPSSLANPNTDLSQTNINSIEDLHSLSGAQIRQLMIDSGAPEDLLSQVSDDQLKEMFLSQLESKTN